MVDEVLCRLNVKDVLRYRSVCKEWRSRIDGLDFIKMHLNQQRGRRGGGGLYQYRQHKRPLLGSILKLWTPLCESVATHSHYQKKTKNDARSQSHLMLVVMACWLWGGLEI
ncbi:F-box domain containing protein [Trema orientale]|uniref:F-box domain containing protein n=1 Tax=Trema orientale TaxID=63057 RepID=A0A2P5FNR2_TREOI|nr:F-box domain containing protein [Trema orientale]